MRRICNICEKLTDRHLICAVRSQQGTRALHPVADLIRMPEFAAINPLN